MGACLSSCGNNALDAPNFFDQGSAPPFQRNQFGGALGGQCSRIRPRIRQLRGVPSEFTSDIGGVRAGFGFAGRWQRPAYSVAKSVADTGCGSAGFQRNCGSFSSPLQTIREDFGTVRVDHIFSHKERCLGSIRLMTEMILPATAGDPYSADVVTCGSRFSAWKRPNSHRFKSVGENHGSLPG